MKCLVICVNKTGVTIENWIKRFRDFRERKRSCSVVGLNKKARIALFIVDDVVEKPGGGVVERTWNCGIVAK